MKIGFLSKMPVPFLENVAPHLSPDLAVPRTGFNLQKQSSHLLCAAMSNAPLKCLKKIALFFSRPQFFSFLLLWLMVLVVAGTLSQRYIGLFESQQRYFSSFFFWQGFIPLPAGRLILALIFLGLTSKLFFKTRWQWSQIGIIVIHFGAMILLGGGFLTAAASTEGRMIIPEGNSSNIIEAYNQIEFALVEVSEKGPEREIIVSQDQLKKGEILKWSDTTFSIQVIDFFKNCEVLKRPEPLQDDRFSGFIKIFSLIEAPLNKEAEQNQSGLLFKVIEEQTAGEKPRIPAPEKTYGVYDMMPVTQTLEISGKKYQATIRHQQTKLPFSIELLDFEKKSYAGTNMAKSYQSQVNLVLPTGKEKYLIHMNHPLRYQEYSFYQASFSEGEKGDTTVLAVVKNPGRIFPYLSSIIMCLGLLLHLLSHLPKHFHKSKAARGDS